MGRPKGSRNKRPNNPLITADELISIMKATLDPQIAALDLMAEDAAELGLDYEPLDIPKDWNLGALLNVRNTGEDYTVTLYPEEYDWRRPERALRFPNSARCQDFISQWYARTWHDPRA